MGRDKSVLVQAKNAAKRASAFVPPEKSTVPNKPLTMGGLIDKCIEHYCDYGYDLGPCNFTAHGEGDGGGKCAVGVMAMDNVTVREMKACHGSAYNAKEGFKAFIESHGFPRGFWEMVIHLHDASADHFEDELGREYDFERLEDREWLRRRFEAFKKTLCKEFPKNYEP